MITVTVTSSDKELISDIWSLKTNDVVLEESMLKSEGWPGEITAYIELAAASLTFIAALLDMIKKHKDKKPSTTKTIIHSSEVIEDIHGIATRYEKIINIEIHKKY